MDLKLTKEKEAGIIIPIFYTVGLIGFLMPSTFPVFTQLIPLVLVLSFILLVIFHPLQESKRATILVFTGIYFSGLLIEIIGVNTGIVFGEYTYGTNLGFKIFNTPLIIGLNWLILVYTTSSFFERLKIHSAYKILMSSICMLAYDIVLEQIAPIIGMWSWYGMKVPLKNYIAWFIIAVAFQSIIKVGGIKTESPIAKNLFICQFVFFLILTVYLH